MLLLLIGFIVAVAFAIGGFLGAPYVPILKRDSVPLLKLSALRPGQTLIDLGSGDGRLLRAAAATGVRGIGYEINPFLVLISRIVCWRYRKLVTIHLADLWRVNLPPCDAIYVFLMPKYMPRLNKKLEAQITRPTRVISYVFDIPGRKALEHSANSYIYGYGEDGPRPTTP